MSKITFRADDELITRLEEFDASKSEVMREALREYLDRHASTSFQSEEQHRTEENGAAREESLDDLIVDRVDTLVADRVDTVLSERLTGAFTPHKPQDVNVNVTLDGGLDEYTEREEEGVNVETEPSNETSHEPSHEQDVSKTDDELDENAAPSERKTCTQCGENLSPSHVYCPNCGEKSAHRVFCDCGDELRSDWAFCPGCGRRTPAADVLDNP